MATAAKIVIPVNMESSGCDVPVFIEEKVVEFHPEVLNGRITPKEWSACLRKLKITVQDNTHSSCCIIMGFCCSPLIAAIYFSHKRSKLEKRLYEDISGLNQNIFGPRGMMMQMRTIAQASCCSNAEFELVLALNSEEAQKLALDPRTGL